LVYLRPIIAVLTLPGVFAGLIPAWIVSTDAHRGGGWPVGFVPIGIGLFLFLWCVRDFFVSGKGTLAPWDPPKHLVVVGLYRYVRNPMYVAILILLTGWSCAVGSRSLAWYTIGLAIAFHLRVVLYEEPRLQRMFGDEWTAYAASVSRWLPRLR